MINISTGLYLNPNEVMLDTILKIVSKKYPNISKIPDGGRKTIILKDENEAVMGVFSWLMGSPLEIQEDKVLIVKIIKEII